jgi:transketolase
MKIMLNVELITKDEFQRVMDANIEKYARLALLSDMCAANTLATVKRAGSGHLGSSFSSLDIVTYLYHHEMNIAEVGIDHPDRDIYFSSKGHDAPGHYAVLHSLGLLPEERFQLLRRLNGTHGHPDVSIPGMEANTGSLGMGISKAKGMAMAKKMQGAKGRVIVMTGDGELQEGQIWESLQTAAYQKINNLIAIVDFNKIQTDKYVKEIIDLGDLTRKFEAFGWHVETCDGHDFAALENAFTRLKQIQDRPKVLIADTIKGKGVSFMEGPQSVKDGNGLYRWHSGAPDNDSFEAGYAEIVQRINARLEKLSLAPLKTRVMATLERNKVTLKSTAEKVVTAYGEALLKIGGERKDIVVLDADLSADCGLRPFEQAYPERFIENGIAEQDMVSAAGGLALHGFLPIVNSFGVFLASRANEQIYCNATEKTKIIYVCHYAGLIPAGPGKSHQSLRDISLFGALPNCTIIEPCNAVETEQALRWCVSQAEHNCMIRLAISPSPRAITLPENYSFSPGKGSVVHDGKDAVLFAYGPVMMNEAQTAAEVLKEQGVSLKVVNLPWLNKVDAGWLAEVCAGRKFLFTLDNHSGYGGIGDLLLNGLMSSPALRSQLLTKFAIDEIPVCGTPEEALAYHKVDGRSLARRIAGAIGKQ